MAHPFGAEMAYRGCDTSPSVSRISVVVISKNEDFLSETLQALEAQCAASAAECVVVDASGGGLSQIRDANPWVRWHDFRGPDGRSVTIPHQRNLGVSIATGDVIAFCDAGGVPENGWLSRLTSPILDGSAAATGGPIRSRYRSSYGTMNDVPTGAPLPMVVTSNFAFARELFDRIGGFDERFDYGSDTDFGWRIEEAGENVVSVRDAVMSIDWGDRRRQLRRDLRYGEAKVRQWLWRRDRRRRIVEESPEILVYPLLFLTTPLAILAAVVTRRWLVVGPWIGAYAIVVLRDVWFGRRIDSMLDHFMVTFGICKELASAAARRRTGGRLDAHVEAAPRGSAAPRGESHGSQGPEQRYQGDPTGRR